MPNFYNGNEMVYPTSITLIDDSDPPDASHFNPTGETLADRTAYINRRFVNGYDGGTYNPSHPIIIGDNGLEMPAAAAWWFYGCCTSTGPSSASALRRRRSTSTERTRCSG
jgi:hypothetical protein